jgi:uncharacterized protein YacL
MKINPIFSVLIWLWGIAIFFLMCYMFPDLFIRSRKDSYVKLNKKVRRKASEEQNSEYKKRHFKLFVIFGLLSIIITTIVAVTSIFGYF